ncbi:MAG TPA: carboxypeptidase-like regulatory domain-containing protein, partial [Kofleriaceae bacterium]
MSNKFGHHAAGSPSVPCRVHGGRTITVTVVEKYSKQPFKGARVALTPPAGAAVPATHTTGESGVVSFNNLATGRYTAQATHPGWWFVEEGERLAGGDHLHLLAFEKKVRWGIDTNLGVIQDTTGTQILDLGKFRAEKKSFL